MSIKAKLLCIVCNSSAICAKSIKKVMELDETRLMKDKAQDEGKR